MRCYPAPRPKHDVPLHSAPQRQERHQQKSISRHDVLGDCSRGGRAGEERALRPAVQQAEGGGEARRHPGTAVVGRAGTV